jgi:RNA polymerase sigma factor (sigma-70 family)
VSVLGFDEVLAAARLGQAWAFRSLYEQYGGRVHGYVTSKGVPEPEEVTNDAFAQAFTSLGRFTGGEAEFRSWLFTIAHRRVVDAYRRSSTRPAALPYEPDADLREGPSAEQAVLDQLADERVRALLDRLGEDQRNVLLLRLVADLTVEQVAATLGKSEASVKALQRRGLAALAKVVEAEAARR